MTVTNEWRFYLVAQCNILGTQVSEPQIIIAKTSMIVKKVSLLVLVRSLKEKIVCADSK